MRRMKTVVAATLFLFLSSTLPVYAAATLLRKEWKSNLVAGQIDDLDPLDAMMEATGDLAEETTDELEEMILDTGLVIDEEQGEDEGLTGLTIEAPEESTTIEEKRE